MARTQLGHAVSVALAVAVGVLAGLCGSAPETTDATRTASFRAPTHERAQLAPAGYQKQVFGGRDVIDAAPATLADSAIHIADMRRALMVERLGVVAVTDADPSVRYEAVDALGEIGEAHAIAALQQALTDPEDDIREAAIDALGYVGGDESAAALGVALDDENAMLREEAVAALANIGGHVAGDLLQQALNDDSDAVRDAARLALADISHAPDLTGPPGGGD